MFIAMFVCLQEQKDWVTIRVLLDYYSNKESKFHRNITPTPTAMCFGMFEKGSTMKVYMTFLFYRLTWNPIFALFAVW